MSRESKQKASLKLIVDRTMQIVDAGVFSTKEKVGILQDIRRNLIEMNRVLNQSNQPPDGGHAA